MAQRYDIIHIDFQANARNANAAIESMRQESERCNKQVKDLQKKLKDGIKANLPSSQIQKLRDNLDAATKQARQFNKAYGELAKGMRVLDQGIKVFNDGSLATMNAAFQKAVYNAAKLTRSRLDRTSASYKKDREEMTALMDATQQYYASIQTDTQKVLDTISKGGKVSRQALTEELQQQKELLNVLSEKDRGYKRTVEQVATLEYELKKMGGSYEFVRKHITDTKRVSSETLRTMYTELEQTNRAGKVSTSIMRENKQAMKEIRAEQKRRVQKVLGGNLGRQSEGDIRQAIASAKELIQVYGTSSKQAQTLVAQIVNAESYLKTVGVEGARAARQQADAALQAADKYKLMQDRMSNITKLSRGAFTETQRFWQEQLDGSKRGSTAYKEAERNLKALANEQQRLNTLQLQKSAKQLNRKNLGLLSEKELQASIAAAKQLAQSMKPGDQAYKDLVNNIMRAEKYVKEFGMEGQRSNRKAAEQMQAMNDNMKNITKLSDGALEETRKFWQTQRDGAERGSKAYETYEKNLNATIKRQQELATAQNKKSADTLLGGTSNLQNMGEGEIRKAIDAAREYQKTLIVDSETYTKLSQAIFGAEEYLQKYGLEAERSAAREKEAVEKAAKTRADANKLMSTQLQQGTALTETALKAQRQYWQRLIDDPKTAATSLKEYQANLAEVQRLQRQQVQMKGEQALDFFRGDMRDASVDEIRKQSEALKQFRDTLPSKTYADLILEINNYLAKTGQVAQKSSQQLMSLSEAFNIGVMGLSNSFKGTSEQLQQAKKVLQEAFAQTPKDTARHEQLRRALDGVALEEKRVGELSKEMQAVIDKPKGHSFNELKIAVEQARRQLNAMTQTTKEEQKAYNELAEKVRAADLELKKLSNTSKGTGSAFMKAVSRLKTYITLYMGTAVAIQKLVGAMGDMMTLSDKMGEVRKTTGFTAEQVGKLSDNLQKLDTRTPIQNLMELSAAAGQLGLNTEGDVRGFTEAANEMLVALPELGQDGATQMMKIAIATGEVSKIRKQMEQGTIQGSSATAIAMEKVASTIDRLRATTAASAPPITEFVKRVGAVGAQSGISIDQVAALGATVDELGMGTEMAATALSRMIPAIKQNAFSIAQAIGVKPETITQLYETGHAMDVILMILKHIKESNMNPDGVEKLLGTGVMASVMKELNQQGARAGIVFAGLSQNVEELERNLGTARNAYQEGTAIMDEYNKMNDTTAAKWERLKNQIQEVFVNNTMQNILGWVIDKVRSLVSLLTGDGGISIAIRTIIGFLALTKLHVGGIIMAFKEMRVTLQSIGVALGILDAQSKKAAMTNIWTALGLAIAYCVFQLAMMTSATGEAYKALGKTREEIDRAEARFEGYWKALEQTNNALNKATAQHRRLSAEVDRLRQSSDQGSKATAQLTKKQEELRNSEKSVTKATADRRAAIGQINSIYGKYLGFLLTERNYALLAASAHDKITAAIEREMLVKQKQASIDAVDSKYSSEIAEKYGKLSDRLVNSGGLSRSQASSTMGALQTWMRQNIYYYAGKSFVRQSALQQLSRGGLDLRGASPQQVAAIWLNDYLKNRYHMNRFTRNNIAGITIKRDNKGGYTFEDALTFGTNLRADYANTYTKRAEEEGAVSEVYNADISNASRNETNASRRNLNGLIADAKRARDVILNKKSGKAAVSQAYGDLANALEGLDNNMQYLSPRRDAKAIAQLRRFATSIRNDKGINSARLLKAQQNAHASMTDLATGNNDYSADTGRGGRAISTAKFDEGEEKNPWGDHPDASSTNWSKYNADELVQRRKQMNDFVRALQGDTDVESVLSQDPALMKAVKGGKVKNDSDSVIEWYNTQRLAIQNVLHGRHLTNTGNWQDPKKTKQRAKSITKQVKDDMAYYLDELDAYYTEQKSRVEDAVNDGEITEEEGWRRTLQNEQVWRKRRAELQQLYTDQSKQVTKKEMDAIFDIISDRTGDTTTFIGANINNTRGMIEKVGEKSMPAMRRIYGELDKSVEQDFLKMRTALKKQLDAIQEIVSKERPFDGIVKNLRQNVEKMGLLYTDLDKRKEKILLSGKGYGSDEMQSLNAEYGTQRNPRLTFLLQQSEDAYSMTWERMANDMRVSGFEDWLDAINSNANADELKEALLAQLRTVYDTVQDAIKREASEVKKQVDIAWNDTTVAGNMSMKQLYEKASTALGMEQSSASRANSLINAGPASERVADRLAIKQMQVQLNMQDHYYALVRKTGQQRIDDLERQAKLKEEQGKLDEAEQLHLDAKHAKMSLNLTLSEEEADLAKQRADLAAKAEESENRLYTSLKEWGSLLSSSAKSVFEASVTGEADYYNSLAKMRLTGEGSAGGTYVITEKAGTKDAVAHYESLDGEDALKRQLEIEQKNATADAWKKVMDDINSKINDQITDWMNAALQNQAIDDNTSALIANTEALYATRPVENNDFASIGRNLEGMAVDASGNIIYPINPVSPDEVEDPYQDDNDPSTWPRARRKRAGLTVNENPFDNTNPDNGTDQGEQWQSPWSDESQGGWNGTSWSVGISDEQVQNITEQSQQIADAQIAASDRSAKVQIANNNKIVASTKSVNKANEEGTRSAFAKMTQAANLYGTAYQAMSNNNLSTSQKFQMFAVQAAGQAAITMLTTDLFQQQAKQTVQMPGILGKLLGEMPYPAAMATYAAVTALMGGLMALAVSQASKSKSQIAQATGANVSAGRLSTGMLTYAEGNVNEFTDPSSLTPGQQYNVDAADGKTYRARYMGANPTTHLTNGPEFHLVGERGREAIIDANTTRQIQMNDTGIWQAIQTLYNGGRVRATRQRGGGMSNFADGNLDEFADGASAQGSAGSAQPAFTDMLAAIQASLDRNSEVMEKAVSNGIKGVFNVYGKGGIIDSYDTGKKNVERYGEKY